MASRNASAPPIDSPPTTTARQERRSTRNSVSTREYQSAHCVRFISSQRVPWPGSRGSRTVKPSAARCSAQGRKLWGHPVKPWQSRKATSPPSAA